MTPPKFTDKHAARLYALVDEIYKRVFPEYDGEKITIQDWGWETPDGRIIYVKGEGEFEKGGAQ